MNKKFFLVFQAIFISKNRITSLQGIQQFERLTTLSASHNPLEDLDVLDALSANTPLLQVATFEGCPMSYLPHYRDHVLVKLPGLKKLDGVAVGHGERQEASRVVDKERVALALMIHNACLVQKLVSSRTGPVPFSLGGQK